MLTLEEAEKLLADISLRLEEQVQCNGCVDHRLLKKKSELEAIVKSMSYEDTNAAV